ncbi:MAG: GNAT family N-acetyltransferase [Rikenellaceae bacterium]|nr:GNAT family N-acetyltransferase [Rikenellaceae bacterium]
MIKITDFDAKLHTNFIKEVFKASFPEYNINELERCLKLTAEQIVKCVIAEYNNRPAGFMFYRTFPEFSYCEYIGVSAEYHNKGIASEIISDVCSDGRQWVFEVEKNKGGRSIFKKFGYVENPYKYDMPRSEEINPGVEYKLWSKYPLSIFEFNKITEILLTDSDF